MSKFHLLVPAAGVGARMKVGYPKQYLQVTDQTLLEVTVTRLCAMSLFDKVAVVVAPSDPYIDNQKLPANVQILRCGGATRGESVFNGLNQLAVDADDWVFVHDAARPCVDKASLLRLMETVTVGDVDGALLAQTMTDTVKWVGEDGVIQKTLDRSRCWRAQTPQAFKKADLVKALSVNPAGFTDEASAMEAAGARVKVVQGSPNNIKVRHREDVALVKKLISDLGESL